MARDRAELPAGTRLTDFMSLGVVAKELTPGLVHEVLAGSGHTSIRQRKLPAHVVVYYVVALAFYRQASACEVLRCVMEGLSWLSGAERRRHLAGPSGITQARQRLGVVPLRALYERCVGPVAQRRAGTATQGAFYRDWRLVGIDGSTFDVVYTPENIEHFGCASNESGASGFPKFRMVSLCECGTRVLFGARMQPYRVSENSMATGLLPLLRPSMLCLADRNFLGYRLWRDASATGAQLLWRLKANRRLPCHERLADGSYLSFIRPDPRGPDADAEPLLARIIEYRLPGLPDSEPRYRLATTLLSPDSAPAAELAELYHERWEEETALGELKTRLRGARTLLRSQTPELIEQEFYGFFLAHYITRKLIHEAALQAQEDPDRLSFTHAAHVIRRQIMRPAALSPSGTQPPPPAGAGRDPRRANQLKPGQAATPHGPPQDYGLPEGHGPQTQTDGNADRGRDR
jgi:hypothetical protein